VRLEDLDGAQLPLVDELAQAGMLAREGAVVRLTGDGKYRMDEALRKIADRLAEATAGLGTDDLTALRHACLLLAQNQHGGSA
jgi:hypothetical protein